MNINISLMLVVDIELLDWFLYFLRNLNYFIILKVDEKYFFQIERNSLCKGFEQRRILVSLIERKMLDDWSDVYLDVMQSVMR